MSAPLESEPSLRASGEIAAAAPAGLAAGQRPIVAGRYRLVEFIAEGGMGAVYTAEHVLSRKKLAIKVVHPYLCKGRQGVERFRREVSAAAAIDHPGIVQVYDAGVDDDGGFFMAMELLRGESLGDLLRREWPGMDRSVALIEEMLEPLAKAHTKGFVHRDLKPDNIFLAVDEEGRERVKILDFGLAREVKKGGPTRTGITFGTPEYMSPEQAISARQVQPPGDVWSVGVMLYELLSGVHPFNGETPNAVMANAIKEPLPPLTGQASHVPVPLARMIERCLQKKPEDRPQDAGEMLAELRAVLGQVRLDDTVPAAPEAPRKWSESGEDEVISSDFPLDPGAPISVEVPVAMSEPAERAPGPKLGRHVPILLGLAAIALAAAVVGVVVAVLDDDPSPVAAVEPPAVPSEPPPPIEAAPALVLEPPPAPVDEAEPTVEAPEPPAVEAPRRARRPRPAEEQGPSALEEARDCLTRGDHQCAKRILEARARSSSERALLIDTYRRLGEFGPMLDHMERFVRRYPRAQQTAGYREDLRRYGR